MRSIFLLSGLIITLSACGSPRQFGDPSAAAGTGYDGDATGKYRQEEQALNQDRLVTYDARLRLQTPAPDSLGHRVRLVAERYDGYMVEQNPGSTTVRVPAASLELVLNELETLGKVKEKNITGRDVTGQHTDLSLRLDNARQARQRYLALLDRAQSVEELLPVERELERLTLLIETLESNLQRLDHELAYASVTAFYEAKVKPGLLGYIGLGLYHGVKWLFVRN
jgi:hypothetical protein